MLSGDRTVIDSSSSFFPGALLSIPVSVERLYVIGDPLALREGLAIIGARKATPYGLACARHFSSLASKRDITIISGGALGCDTAAHKAALEAKGKTVVFLGGGCDQLYPKANKHLFQEIINQGGAIVSEYDWGHPPMKYAFRARNRLIAGLAKATLIVEAGLPSGTFSTADEALAANKEVLVVPGSIASKSSRGSNRLLYQGAIPVVDDESFDDILFSLFGVLKQEDFSLDNKIMSEMNAFHKNVYEILCSECLHMDELLEKVMRMSRWEKSHGELMQVIVELERDGLIARYPDGKYGVSKF